MVLIVLLGAAAGGAKLGQVVTRADIVALDAAKEATAEGKPGSSVIQSLGREHK